MLNIFVGLYKRSFNLRNQLQIIILTFLSAGNGFLYGCSENGVEPFVWSEWENPASADLPRPERPNPNFMRRNWQNLNGEWEFELDENDVGLSEDWVGKGKSFSRKIMVPFSWTSPLSGVAADTGDKGGIGWYRKNFELSNEMKGMRIHLIIGAADWEMVLFINGKKVETPDIGGYLPIKCDITDYIKDGENEIVLRVKDYGADAGYPHGKQGNPWYANVGGVWQTVYLEATGDRWFESIRLTPDAAAKSFNVKGVTAGLNNRNACKVEAYAKGRGDRPVFKARLNGNNFEGLISVPWLDVWSPANPALQDFDWLLDCGGILDDVRNYAGLRSVGRGKLPGKDYEAVTLNGEPVYIRGVLVQGYNPQGYYTYPNEQYLINDLQAAKTAGFNLVRLHIKVEEPLLLYHADRLGLLVDYDVPCYGQFPFKAGDGEEARKRWQTTMEGMIERDYNHPSIIWWTLFNEDWGFMSLTEEYDSEKREFVKGMLARARELDSSRLIEDHSTLRYDHVAGTDLNSFHIYNDVPGAFELEIKKWVDGCYEGSNYNFAEGEKQDTAPLINAEYGPFSSEYTAPLWKRDRDISWGFRMLTTIMRGYGKLVGYVFTELYDVEFELNGVMDYDRTLKEFGYPQGITPASINSANFIGFAEPYFQVEKGAISITLHPFASRFDPGLAASGNEYKLKLSLYDAFDSSHYETTVSFSVKQWNVAQLSPIDVSLPADVSGGAYFFAQWKDETGSTLAQNFLPGEIIAPKISGAECGVSSCVVPLDLSFCEGATDANGLSVVDGEAETVGFIGEGALVCVVALPLELPKGINISIEFDAEMSSNVEGAPQTHNGSLVGGSVKATLGAVELGEVNLPADRADSRGVLSHLNGSLPKGGFGELLKTKTAGVQLTGGETMKLKLEASGNSANGLLVYGRRTGRFGVQPMLRFEWGLDK